MPTVNISRETRKQLIRDVRNRTPVAGLLYDFILTDQSFYQVLSQAAREVGNTRFFQDLDLRLNAIRRADQNAPLPKIRPDNPKRLVNPPASKAKLANRSEEKNRTDLRKGNRRNNSNRRKISVKDRPWAANATSGVLSALVARINRDGHKCQSPHCGQSIPWENAYCPACQIKAITNARLVAEARTPGRCAGCGGSAALIGEGLCMDCLGKGR
jgi:hypothetical protein